MKADFFLNGSHKPLHRSLLQLCMVTLVLLLTACATSLPKDVERPVSNALEQPQKTALGAMIGKANPVGPRSGTSAFALISGPEFALSSRMALVENAEKTLDLQYYAIHADQSTSLLIRALVKAARRGVRVRVLLDDFHSTGPDAQVMRLAFVPNIEMRMFNPLAGSRGSSLGRAWTILTDFQRAQQRMHNKLFIADNVVAVMGGRNLGDAYFDASTDGNFVDLDVLTAGPVVKDLSRSFDSYWNNVRSYPVQSLISSDELRQLKSQFDQEDRKTQNAQAPASPAIPPAPMNLNKVPWVWAQAMVLADKPSKVPVEGDELASSQNAQTSSSGVLSTGPLNKALPTAQILAADSVVDGLLALVRSAKKDLLVVSPYFVPGTEIMDAFRSARTRGVRIRILTNSLASNDAPLAHAGYARHRQELLGLGIELREMRSESANVRSAFRAGASGSSGGSGGSGTGASRAMLHSKLLVVDGKLVIIGSMNLDMRSQHQNTEIAVLIASRVFSQLATGSIEDGLPEGSWLVQLDPQGKIVWRAPEGSGLQDASTEPDASLGLRLMLQLLGPLAPDSLL